MIYVTQEQYERDLTGWQNITETKRLLRLTGVPTIAELKMNYLLTHIIVQTKEVELMERVSR